MGTVWHLGVKCFCIYMTLAYYLTLLRLTFVFLCVRKEAIQLQSGTRALAGDVFEETFQHRPACISMEKPFGCQVRHELPDF